jgi:hypothetical protein
MKKRCITCKFAVFVEPGSDKISHCRALPPQALSDNHCSFPLIMENETWCWMHRFSVVKWLKWTTRRASGTEGKREDHSDLVKNITPTPTPFLENGAGPVAA